MMNKYQEIGAEPKTTIAATTLAYFEKNFYGKKITHNFTQEQIDFFHEGYYGGRTEIFFNKPVAGNIYYSDINSLYPYCLKKGTFPQLEHFYETKKPDFSLHGAADVNIQAPWMRIPYLPCRFDGKLVFPTGRFRGVYTYFELREAIRLGYKIERCHRAIEFPGSFNPFINFIDSIYSERLKAQKQKDELMSLVFKAFGNFAYGKYAQKNETVELVPTIELDTSKLETGTIILGGELALVKKKIDYPRYANCIWACYTTAYARHELYERGLLRVENTKGARLLYCDTDSVIYENKTQIIPHSKELGEFKLEGVFKYAHFKLPKLYKLVPKSNKPHIYKAKGVPSRAAKRFFINNSATYKKPNKLRETLRRNLNKSDKYKLIPNYWEVTQKEISSKYEKRVVLRSGRTKPLTLNQ